MAGLSRISIVLMVLVGVVHSYLRTGGLKFEVDSILRNCRDVQREGNRNSGVYTIFPYDCCPYRPVEVFCDMETDGGGWTVIQRRDDIEPREDFYRTWMEYALGFGNLKGEFWLGLDHIHALTDQTLNIVRSDMADFEGNTRWAKYKFFYVHDRSMSYKLEVIGYTGDAGDGYSPQHNQKFSAKDIDLDSQESEHCARKYKGGWWYDRCHHSNPNGLYLSGTHTSNADGVNWAHWRGNYYSLKKIDIKIRPSE